VFAGGVEFEEAGDGGDENAGLEMGGELAVVFR
jgi:hypothetical protein